VTIANAPQRRYTAPCPGCGAPVEFRAAQSTHAVCGYCHSTVVRQGDVLSRLGKMGELFDDHSPLQLFATGKFKKQNTNALQTFTLIGRLQYKTSEGTWTEWNAFFDDGSTGWLAEDNGAYVFTQANATLHELPAADRFTVGKQVTINSKSYSVASNVKATLISAQGELPKLPPLGEPFDVVELRNAMGEVLSIDYTATPPVVSQGMAVMLDDLALQGLKDEKDGSVKEEKGRQFNCPHCGSPVTVALATSKSITCGSCNTLIDLSQGVGKELQAAIQEEPIQPLIPLGATGKLQGTAWQVVGFQHRMGQEPDDPDEQFGWSEYLLYNQKRGFSFLVDSEEGWSLVRPTTGAPTVNAKIASYQGKNYTLKYRYQAQTEYVCGEFYWLVQRGQTTQNQDFANGKNLLSLEQTKNEAVWSAGGIIASDAVAKAFNLDAKSDLFKRDDASPLSSSSKIGVGFIIVIIILMVILVVLLSTCSSSSSGSRTSGGSYGGSSGGGGHK
jgi:ribosomal protein S27AE